MLPRCCHLLRPPQLHPRWIAWGRKARGTQQYFLISFTHAPIYSFLSNKPCILQHHKIVNGYVACNLVIAVASHILFNTFMQLDFGWYIILILAVILGKLAELVYFPLQIYMQSNQAHVTIPKQFWPISLHYSGSYLLAGGASRFQMWA